MACDERPVVLNDLLGFLSDNMPEDWEIQISITRTEVDLSLFDPEWESRDTGCHESGAAHATIECLNQAREASGLEPVTFPGLATDVDS